MKNKWFKRKAYGWGWTPATVEGWLVMLVYFVSIGMLLFTVNRYNASPKVLTITFFALTFALIVITAATGEKPKWQWGNKGRKEK
jgi:hypothetical protein